MEVEGPDIPAGLAITEEQLESKQPVRLSLSLRNPTGGYLWINATAEGPFARLYPAMVTLGPRGLEHVTVTLDTALVTAANHASGRVRLAWRALGSPGSTAPGTGGERVVALQVPRPRKRHTCPRPGCGATVRDGDATCGRCELMLRFCPVCGTPHSRAESLCRADNRHVLRQSDPWPQVGGSAARAGASHRALSAPVSLAWSFRPAGLADCSLGAPVVAYDLAFVVATLPTGDGRLYALDVTTGAPLWEVRLPEGESPHPDRSAPSVRAEGLYLATVGGFVIAIEATSGRQRWVSRLPERIFPAPAAAEDCICVASTRADLADGHLVSLCADDGARISSYPLGGKADTPPALAAGVAYVTCDDGTVRAIDTGKGAALWSVEAGAEFEAGPCIVDGVVYAGSTAGELLAVDAASGTLQWRLKLSDTAVETLPVVANGRVYCATADGSIHTASAAGKAVGSVSVGAQLRGAPVAGDGLLLLGAEDGRLYRTDGIQSVEAIYDTGRGRRISAPLCLAFPFLLFSATGGELFALKLEGGK
jgi:outer membrane protein assembly factor BamB